MIHFRKLLLATSAVVTAGAMALGPAAMASPTNVSVGDSTTGDHTVNLTMKSASVNINVYGIPWAIACAAASASGVAHAGTGLANYATLSSLSATCPSIWPGTTVAVSAVCGIDVQAGSAASNPVPGAVKFTNGSGTDCVQVSISNGCTLKVAGTPSASFNATPKVVGGVTYQDLTLSGSPTLHNVSGCLGSVSNNQTFTLDAVFGVQSPDGLIDLS